MNKQITEKVFRRVQSCMNALVGGSGHLAAFYLIEESFRITKTKEVGGKGIQYHFTALAYRESEFTEYTDDYKPETERLSGSIVLDGDFNYVRNEKGEIMLAPWKCLDPEQVKKSSDDDMDRLLNEVFAMKDEDK